MRIAVPATANQESPFRKASEVSPGMRRSGSSSSRLVGAYWNLIPRRKKTSE